MPLSSKALWSFSVPFDFLTCVKKVCLGPISYRSTGPLLFHNNELKVVVMGSRSTRCVIYL